MMNYTFCAQTDQGRVRKNMEDSVAFDERTQLGVLADGMGGYNAGEVASSMATTHIKSEFTRWFSQAGPQVSIGQVRHAVATCVDSANRAILDAARSTPRYSKMGTTLVVGVFLDARLMLGHIGDSRCYRLRGSELMQLTRDHSLLQEKIDAGYLTREQAATAPNKNLVTRALGVEETVQLELNEFGVEAGDIYLMCSDGLCDMLKDAEIKEILQNGSALAQMATELVARANTNGGRDNISVLLTQASSASEKTSYRSRSCRN